MFASADVSNPGSSAQCLYQRRLPQCDLIRNLHGGTRIQPASSHTALGIGPESVTLDLVSEGATHGGPGGGGHLRGDVETTADQFVATIAAFLG